MAHGHTALGSGFQLVGGRDIAPVTSPATDGLLSTWPKRPYDDTSPPHDTSAAAAHLDGDASSANQRRTRLKRQQTTSSISPGGIDLDPASSGLHSPPFQLGQGSSSDSRPWQLHLEVLVSENQELINGLAAEPSNISTAQTGSPAPADAAAAAFSATGLQDTVTQPAHHTEAVYPGLLAAAATTTTTTAVGTSPGSDPLPHALQSFGDHVGSVTDMESATSNGGGGCDGGGAGGGGGADGLGWAEPVRHLYAMLDYVAYQEAAGAGRLTTVQVVWVNRPPELGNQIAERLICKASGSALWPRTLRPMGHGEHKAATDRLGDGGGGEAAAANPSGAGPGGPTVRSAVAVATAARGREAGGATAATGGCVLEQGEHAETAAAEEEPGHAGGGRREGASNEGPDAAAAAAAAVLPGGAVGYPVGEQSPGGHGGGGGGGDCGTKVLTAAEGAGRPRGMETGVAEVSAPQQQQQPAAAAAQPSWRMLGGGDGGTGGGGGGCGSCNSGEGDGTAGDCRTLAEAGILPNSHIAMEADLQLPPLHKQLLGAVLQTQVMNAAVAAAAATASTVTATAGPTVNDSIALFQGAPYGATAAVAAAAVAGRGGGCSTAQTQVHVPAQGGGREEELADRPPAGTLPRDRSDGGRVSASSRPGGGGCGPHKEGPHKERFTLQEMVALVSGIEQYGLRWSLIRKHRKELLNKKQFKHNQPPPQQQQTGQAKGGVDVGGGGEGVLSVCPSVRQQEGNDVAGFTGPMVPLSLPLTFSLQPADGRTPLLPLPMAAALPLPPPPPGPGPESGQGSEPAAAAAAAAATTATTAAATSPTHGGLPVLTHGSMLLPGVAMGVPSAQRQQQQQPQPAAPLALDIEGCPLTGGTLTPEQQQQLAMAVAAVAAAAAAGTHPHLLHSLQPLQRLQRLAEVMA
ncbi:hypothetical protein VOLCADRAFT_93586 [Volvox carteri f. nagariensis]|uniref:Myb-like domain-containing protein n=1 Tax=Volvox carteri f. nagariensis TaxID=3068 RepID=D8U2I0_VOLCA|nr:uncharacterized protein VOLCADRAFT_93586 [Volvox carteri f. nagariensis]EFJ46139.1 hypothetical protein VOLCADRAFT_93586 [Volvox carteri f. nagariensis]|eukprot:XP_002952889.1 hypothetical protein VOLCADRAFT_93586 [Volvox carteri f. nagariensis]